MWFLGEEYLGPVCNKYWSWIRGNDDDRAPRSPAGNWPLQGIPQVWKFFPWGAPLPPCRNVPSEASTLLMLPGCRSSGHSRFYQWLLWWVHCGLWERVSTFPLATLSQVLVRPFLSILGGRPGCHLQCDFARGSASVEGHAAWESCSRSGPTCGGSCWLQPASSDRGQLPSHNYEPSTSQPLPVQTEGTVDSRKEKVFYNSGSNPTSTFPARTDLSISNGQKTHPVVIPGTLVWLCGPSRAIS